MKTTKRRPGRLRSPCALRAKGGISLLRKPPGGFLELESPLIFPRRPSFSLWLILHFLHFPIFILIMVLRLFIFFIFGSGAMREMEIPPICVYFKTMMQIFAVREVAQDFGWISWNSRTTKRRRRRPLFGS